MKPWRTLVITTASLILMVIVSCEPNRNGEPVKYGQESSADDINKALVSQIQDVNLNNLAVGQFVHFSTTDNLAGGQVVQVESDTGQTIVDRNDQSDYIGFSVVQNKFTYTSSAPQKDSIEYQLNIARTSPLPSPSPTPSQTPSPIPVTSIASKTASIQIHLINEIRHFDGRLFATSLGTQGLTRSATGVATRIAIRDASPTPAESPTPDSSPTPPETKVTFHRLKAWEDLESAPDLVQKQANCLGIPHCKIRVRHVTFDRVSWDTPQGTKIGFDLAMSPDVPPLSGYRMTPIFEYYPGLIKSCLTLLVDVGTNGGKTLLTQCNETENFSFTAQPGTN